VTALRREIQELTDNLKNFLPQGVAASIME